MTDIDAVCETVVLDKNIEIDSLRAEVAERKRTIAQRDKDWDALTMLLLETLGTDEERESPEDAIEEFDPWETLRRHAKTLAIVEAAIAWRASHHTGHQRSSRELIAAIDKAIDAARGSDK